MSLAVGAKAVNKPLDKSNSPLFETDHLFVHLDQIASCIINANHSIISAAVQLEGADCVQVASGARCILKNIVFQSTV